jgi:hypothetical protein
MYTRLLFVLRVEVGSRLAIILTQLNGSLAGMVESLCIAASV